jgi:hypothetical protein
MRIPVLLPLLAILAAAPVHAQQEPASFVVLLGSDTVAAEQYRRIGNRIEGRQLVRSPRATLRRYTAFLNPDGTTARVEISWQRPGAPEHARAAVDFRRDTALVQLAQEGQVHEWRVPAPAGSVPYLGSAIGLYEPALARFRRGGRARWSAAMVPIGGNEPEPLALRRIGRDSVLVTTLTGDNRVAADAAGRIAGWNGIPSNFKIVAHPAPGIDLDRLTTAFAERERRGGAMGVLSPTDSVSARIAGAEVTVRYGRPSRRGRAMFGGILPWGEVWRTGANQATQLTTGRDLRIGGVRVPAGSYTLFSIPSPDRWTLIINRQTGQAGTEYDPARDLARIPMRRESLAEPVEQFTIALEPDGGGGRLALMWDDTRVWVPVE